MDNELTNKGEPVMAKVEPYRQWHPALPVNEAKPMDKVSSDINVKYKYSRAGYV